MSKRRRSQDSVAIQSVGVDRVVDQIGRIILVDINWFVDIFCRTFSVDRFQFGSVYFGTYAVTLLSRHFVQIFTFYFIFIMQLRITIFEITD
jgi:hypothetical protein